jgi:hypothetical protein
MEKEFDYLIAIFQKFDGFSLVEKNIELSWIHFKIISESNLISDLYRTLAEIRDQHPFGLLVLANKQDPNDFSYQLIIESKNQSAAINVLVGKLLTLVPEINESKKFKNQDLGIPDLSLVTIRQMANELKLRSNLTFALVWIENNERDNIAIEGSGNPTQLIGLLTRGSHMAIEWADKNIKFYKPKDDE